MEPKKKDWNTKAKLGYAKMLERAMADEKRRNGSVEGEDVCKKCLASLKKLDGEASGAVFTGNMDADRVSDTEAAALASNGLLNNYIRTLHKASDDFRDALAQIAKAAIELSTAGKGIEILVKEARADAKKKVRGLIVRRKQCSDAVDAAQLRLKALAKELHKATVAGDSKLVTTLLQKSKKMEHEFELLSHDFGRIFGEMTECLNAPGRDQ